MVLGHKIHQEHKDTNIETSQENHGFVTTKSAAGSWSAADF